MGRILGDPRLPFHQHRRQVLDSFRKWFNELYRPSIDDELFALEWSAVNLTEGMLSVRGTLEELGSSIKTKEPKTRAGRRAVVLGSQAIEALNDRRETAKSENLLPPHCKLVFPNLKGGPLRGSNFDRQVWYPIRDAAGIPDTVTFHDLRHTQASLLLSAGVDLKVIQPRLGHADFSTTANIYAHLMQGAQADAVAKLEGVLRPTGAKSES